MVAQNLRPQFIEPASTKPQFFKSNTPILVVVGPSENTTILKILGDKFTSSIILSLDSISIQKIVYIADTVWMIGIQMKGQGVSIRKLVANGSFRFFNNIQTRQLKLHLQGPYRLLRDRSLLIRKS